MSIVQSAGGIIYYMEADQEPRYLLIKRLALSKKIERVAPKGKVQWWESFDIAAMREISEETSIAIKDMSLMWEVGKTSIRNTSQQKWWIDKDVTYFLIEYTGNPNLVRIQNAEWYVGIYKRATIQEVLWLLHYQNIRELFRSTYQTIIDKYSKNSVKNAFLEKI